MARCSKCGGRAAVIAPKNLPEGAYEMNSLSYADAGKRAWHCSRCDKLYCGRCCFPRFAKLQQEKGLSSEQLSRQIESSEEGFFEMPQCPECRSLVSDELPAKHAGTGCAGMIFLALTLHVVIMLW